jgi:hypothetical protein
VEGSELDVPRSGEVRGISREQLGSEGDFVANHLGLIGGLAQQRDGNLGASIRREVRVGRVLRFVEVDRQLPANAAAIARRCGHDARRKLYDVGVASEWPEAHVVPHCGARRFRGRDIRRSESGTFKFRSRLEQ